MYAGDTKSVGKKQPLVLMIIGLFYPSVGGAERECHKLAGKLREEGASVSVLTQYCAGLPECEQIDGIMVYRKMKGWHWFEITYMVSVLRFLIAHRKRYDIIQCFGLYLFIPPALVMRYLFGKKVIARLECSGRFGDFWRMEQLRYGKLVMASAKLLNAVIFISKEIEEELLANGFPAGMLMHVTNCVDVRQFIPADNRKAASAKEICFVGRLEQQKGLEYLIRAINLLKNELDDIKLTIVGDGSMRAALEALCAKMNVGQHIFFAGARDDVLSYYQRARFFVLPSLSEGLPLTLLEAMACGLAVIASDVGGNREVLDPHNPAHGIPEAHYYIGTYGIMVNPGDVEGLARAMLRLLTDNDLADQLKSRARSHVEEVYALDKIIDDYQALYRSLL